MIKAINKWRFERDDGLFRRYWGMVSRCKYKSNTNYHHYGGRGIIVLWKSYDEFKYDMGSSFKLHCEQFGLDKTFSVYIA